jgi:hypothetical protein
MKQTYTSRATSINAAKLPKVYGTIPALPRHSLLLDYGCGRYTDHIQAALPGVTYLPYDPFNQPEDVNAHSLYYVRLAMHVHMPVTVVCSNVLNVIDSDDAVRDIAATIRQIIDATGGTAYITVYAGDRSGRGRQTGPDQYQRNEPISAYLHLFPGAVISHGAIIYHKEASA